MSRADDEFNALGMQLAEALDLIAELEAKCEKALSDLAWNMHKRAELEPLLRRWMNTLKGEPDPDGLYVQTARALAPDKAGPDE